ncbi:DNA-binding response regulator [Desulfonema ishimotonii]|uniref:DNA-binding response regulator n=1 Tax=Desulfonema ishimotonii TaxID=45657 RepID=A0A401FYA4_9BACT|nr:response regulator [Desulfonema ishimotonii]GBC61923.1 DNA-binding response regulator [Desulfonema ishimotonii]
MSGKTILIVEDELKIAQVLRDYLEKAGYATNCLSRGDTVPAHVQKNPPGLILLDLMLPGMDGTEVCREIRKFSNVPIIIITARVEELDRIIGLELGADDYICKPFSPREVVARVKAVLRRASPDVPGKALVLGPIRLDEDLHQVLIYDNTITLTPSEHELLKIMISQPGRVFSRSELIGQIQGYDFEGYERTIDSHIKNLRKKMAEFFPNQDIIRAVYGIGYKLVVQHDPVEKTSQRV